LLYRGDGEPLLEVPHFSAYVLIETCELQKENTIMADLNGPRSNFPEVGSNPSIEHLRLTVDGGLISRFLKLVERGCKLQIKKSVTIRELLCQQLGISKDYVDNRIQTIFLDGKAVDDVDTATVENGSKLALSAAMPGLVGITFRKGGFYAALRETISYTKTGDSAIKGAGEIILKLFNLIAKELGPELLSTGIRIEGNAFQNFVLRNFEDLKSTCTSVHLNDAEIDVAKLKETKWKDQEVFLQVTSEAES
jgi:hypothetical protein